MDGGQSAFVFMWLHVEVFWNSDVFNPLYEVHVSQEAVFYQSNKHKHIISQEDI